MTHIDKIKETNTTFSSNEFEVKLSINEDSADASCIIFNEKKGKTASFYFNKAAVKCDETIDQMADLHFGSKYIFSLDKSLTNIQMIILHERKHSFDDFGLNKKNARVLWGLCETLRQRDITDEDTYLSEILFNAKALACDIAHKDNITLSQNDISNIDDTISLSEIQFEPNRDRNIFVSLVVPQINKLLDNNYNA